MYARRLKIKRQNLNLLFQRSYCYYGQANQDVSRAASCGNTIYRNHASSKNCTRNLNLFSVSLPIRNYIGSCRRHQVTFSYGSLRLYSSDGDGRNASEDKHVPVKGPTDFEKGKGIRGEVLVESKRSDEHARLGKQDQQDWLECEKLFIDNRKKESPFLTKRDRFKSEFLRRVIPWEKITVSWETFPYFIHDHTKNLLVECAASHLKHKSFTSSYGARLPSSSGRILLQSIPGTELYRERLVRALARGLQVPLLVLDSTALAPYDFSQEWEAESETEDENEDSGEESTSELEAEDENEASNEEEWGSSNEAKSEESDDSDHVDVQAAAETLKKLGVTSLEEFAKRVSGEVDGTSASGQSESVETSNQSKRPLRKGDRVKYVGASVHIEVDNRPLSNGQRGEVYEVNGDQVAVILDNSGNKPEEGNEIEKSKEHCSKSPIYWIDIQDIVHDLDTQAEDWHMAMETLCEVLPSLQPIIVYFPDSSQWLSRAVPKVKRKEFLHKVEEMFDQLSGPVVLICGQNKLETGSKEKEKFTMVLPNLGRLARLPVPLKRLTEGLRSNKSSKDNEIYRLFTNTICIHPPKEEEIFRTFNKQLEEDRRIIISRSNVVELHKVLEEHDLSCAELLHVDTDGVILTKQKAERVVGWARNHYLSSCVLPSVKGDRLMVPRESMEIAISRLKEQESVSRKPSQSLKSLAKDEYESNFISAVVSPDEIGVKFDDIGALEDVKTTLSELVTLPMRRPELFSHGNLLRPCKGILLFGPPGTGKTLLAKALATEAGANFISITGSALTSKNLSAEIDRVKKENDRSFKKISAIQREV